MSTHELPTAPLHARDLLVRDLATVPQSATVSSALALMEHLEVRHLPVLDGDGLVGLLHEPDLRGLPDSAPVGPHVHRDVPRARLQDSVGRLATLVSGSTCGAVVVLDDEQHLLGLLTGVDLERPVVRPARTGAVPGGPDGGA